MLWDIFWLTNLINYYLLELSLVIKAIAILDIGSTLRFVLLLEAVSQTRNSLCGY